MLVYSLRAGIGYPERMFMIGSKKRIIAIVLFLAFVGAYLALVLLPMPTNYPCDNPFLKGDGKPNIVAHRGGGGEFPQNTLEAFYNAYSIDEDVIMETDVNLTKDGVLILLHNQLLDATTNVTGLASEWNYSDLIAQRVDFGYSNPTENTVLAGEREHFNIDGVNVYPTDVSYPEGVIPRDEEIFLATTFEELLLAFPDNLISVEIKQEGELGIAAAKETRRLVEKYDAYDRVVFASFHTEVIKEFASWQRKKEVPESFMYAPGIAGIVKYYALSHLGLNSLYTDSVVSLPLPTDEYGISLATSRIVENAHKRNIAVMYWTINDEGEMRELIELGADGIMTDYPSRLKGVLDEYGAD